MPVDGLGGDAGRQSLTDVGVVGARAPRRARATPVAPPPVQAPRIVDAAPIAPPDSKRSPWHLRGERLVALCALAVLAIAVVFFLERIAGYVRAPSPAFTPPTL